MKPKSRLFLKLFVGAVLFGVLCQKFSIKAQSFVAGVRCWAYFTAALFLPVTIIPMISVNRWRAFLALLGICENFFSLWRINLISMFQGLVIPSTHGYDALRMYHIGKRHPGMVSASSGSVVIERMIGLLVFCAVALCGLPFVVQYVNSKWPILVGALGFTGVAVFGFALAINRRVHNLYSGWRPKNSFFVKIIAFMDKTHGALVDFPYRKVLLSSIVLILLFQLSTILSVYLLFRAYGVDLPFYMHMAFYPVIAIIAMMPVTIGGFGVREGAFAYFYSLVGVPAEVSVCVSVANYVVLSLLPAALGGVIWLLELAFCNRT